MTRIRLKRWLELEAPSVLVIAAATLVLCWPLLQHTALNWGSDVSFHVGWAKGFIQSLHNGVLYPRWNATINRALGGPVFIFYPPLPFYFVALVNAFTGNLFLSFRIVLVLGGFLSGLSFFVFARSFATRPWATFGAVFYLLLPYHALDLYDRFAFAEYLAFIWVPILFLAIRKLAEDPEVRAWTLFAVSLAGLLTTHILTAFMAVIIGGPYGLALMARNRRRYAFAAILTAGLVGTAIAGIYVIPATVERSLSHMEWTTDLEFARWDRHLLFHNGERPGEEKLLIKPLVDRTAVCQLIVMGVALLLFLGRRAIRGKATNEYEAWLFFALACWSFFLEILPSSPIWEHVPGFASVQFPWRFLAFHVLSLSAFAALLGSPSLTSDPKAVAKGRRKASVGQGPWRKLGRNVTEPAVIGVLVGLAAIPAVNYTVFLHYERPYTFSVARSRMMYIANRTVKEYIPKPVPSWDIVEESRPASNPVRVSSGGSATIVAWEPEKRVVDVEMPEAGTVTLWTFNYPAWRATIDGNPARIRSADFLDMIEIPVASGEHRVEVVFGSTPDRKVGALVSLAGLLILIGVNLKGPLQRRKRRRT